jgi:hypothetical protein
MAMKAFGMLDEEETPPPSYMTGKLSVSRILGLDTYTYIPGIGYTDKSHIYDTLLDFVPFGRETSPVEHLTATVGSKMYPHIKLPFQTAMGVNFMNGNIVPVKPTVGPGRHTFNQLESYLGAPVATLSKG